MLFYSWELIIKLTSGASYICMHTSFGLFGLYILIHQLARFGYFSATNLFFIDQFVECSVRNSYILWYAYNF